MLLLSYSCNFYFQHRLFSHRQYNAPESIQMRNREHMDRQASIRKDTEDLNRPGTKKLKKMQTFKSFESNADTSEGYHMETREGRQQEQTQGVKFLPRPPPQERFTSPIGARRLSKSSKHSATSSDIKGNHLIYIFININSARPVQRISSCLSMNQLKQFILTEYVQSLEVSMPRRESTLNFHLVSVSTGK